MALQHEPYDRHVVETYRRLLQDIAWYRRKWWLYPLIAGLFASVVFLPISKLPMGLCLGLVAITMLFVATMPFRLVDKLQEQLDEYVGYHPWVVARYNQMYSPCPASSP